MRWCAAGGPSRCSRSGAPCYSFLTVITLLTVSGLQAAAAETAPQPQGRTASLKDVVNEGFSWDAPSSLEEGLKTPAKLMLARVWEPPAGAVPRLPITVFTTTTLNRMSQLQRQCRSWPGPLVAAVWAPIVLPLPDKSPSAFQASPASEQTQSPTRRLRGGSEAHRHLTRTLDAAGGVGDEEQHEPLNAVLKQFDGWWHKFRAQGRYNQRLRNGSRGLSAGGRGLSANELPSCHLTILLFVQAFRDAVSPTFLFPVNSLRNYALLMARTPLVSMVDVDLMWGKQFIQSLLDDPGRVNVLVNEAEAGTLFIPPAFEAMECKKDGCVDGIAAGLKAVSYSKPELALMMKASHLDTFHCKKGTHWMVDYRKWFGAKTDYNYEVRFAPTGEPWYIGHRSIHPFYDTRYKGFGFNKQIQLLYATGNLGLRLKVLHDGFLVHLPHSKTKASEAFANKGKIRGAIFTAPADGKRLDLNSARIGSLEDGIISLGLTQDEDDAPDSTTSTASYSANGLIGSLVSYGRLLRTAMSKLYTSARSSQSQEETDAAREEQDKDSGEKAVAPLSIPVARQQKLALEEAMVYTEEMQRTAYAKIFHAHMWALGSDVRTLTVLPEGSLPVLDAPMRSLLKTLPWWIVESSKWPKGQPGPEIKLRVQPQSREAYSARDLVYMKQKMQMCMGPVV